MSFDSVTIKISRFLKFFDKFGDSHTFKVNSDKTFNSPLGGLTFICFMFYAIYYFYYSFSLFQSGNFQTKETYSVIKEKQIISTADYTNFVFGACLKNSENFSNDEFLDKNLNITLYYEKHFFNKESMSTSNDFIPMVDCSEYYKSAAMANESFSNIFLNQLKIFDLKQCKCFSFRDRNLQMYSLYEGLEKYFFSINLNSKTGTGTEKATLDYIKQARSKLSIFFPDASINYNDDKLPVKPVLRFKDYFINPNYTQVNELKFGLLSFSDYNSFVSKGKIFLIYIFIYFIR